MILPKNPLPKPYKEIQLLPLISSAIFITACNAILLFDLE